MRKILAIALVSLLVVGFIGGITIAKGSNEARVIIGFKGLPNAAAITAVGGTINATYDIIPAIAATVPEAAINGLKNNPLVDYVEYDAVAYALAQTIPWGITKVNADDVWATGNRGDNIKVCIIDTGVDMDHQDLAYLGGYDYVNGDAYPDDDHGHGSHCAGISTALDNTVGVIGVAPLAHLYATKVLNSAGSGSYSAIVSGINWAVNNGCNVLSMSLGGTSGSSALSTACQNAWNAGRLVVAAAGNSGNAAGTGDNVLYPARYTSVIAVAATDSNNVRASFSSTGPTVELAAPGVSIYSCYKNNGYTTMSGTSMACPHVTGVAALVWAAQPGVSNQHVRDAMNYTATDLGAAGRDSLYGYGLVNAQLAVGY